MYYLECELDQMLPESGSFPLSRLKRGFAAVAEQIEADPLRYRSFGGYWAELRPLVKSPQTIRNADPISTSRLLAAAEEYYRLQHLDVGPADDEDSSAHIWESEPGRPELFISFDTDQEAPNFGQLDLFEQVDRQRVASESFLRSPGDFIARVWKDRGDDEFARGNWHQAARYYKRGALLPGDEVLKSACWLAMGLAFESAGHFWKAIFCFQTSYQRDSEAWLLGNIASCHRSLGRIHDALKYYRLALESMPGNPEFLAAISAIESNGRSSSTGRAYPSNSASRTGNARHNDAHEESRAARHNGLDGHDAYNDALADGGPVRARKSNAERAADRDGYEADLFSALDRHRVG